MKLNDEIQKIELRLTQKELRTLDIILYKGVSLTWEELLANKKVKINWLKNVHEYLRLVSKIREQVGITNISQTQWKLLLTRLRKRHDEGIKLELDLDES